MQTARIVQAVVLMMIVAVAASCSASKEYTSKLFAPRTPVVKDSQALALRFLELDNIEPDQENWVTTDIIMGRDTMSQTLALDKLAQVFPAAPAAAETIAKSTEAKASPTSSEIKKTATEPATIAKNSKSKKKSKKDEIKPIPVPVETAPEVVEAESVPVARNINSGEVRSKKSREQ